MTHSYTGTVIHFPSPQRCSHLHWLTFNIHLTWWWLFYSCMLSASKSNTFHCHQNCLYNDGLNYIYLCTWLSAKKCTCKGLCTSFENKTLLKTVFIWNVVLCTCMNEWIYSTDNFSNQAVVDFKIQSSHTEKAPINDRQKRTSMYQVIFITLLTNKLQAHGETLTDLYAENIVLYG